MRKYVMRPWAVVRVALLTGVALAGFIAAPEPMENPLGMIAGLVVGPFFFYFALPTMARTSFNRSKPGTVVLDKPTWADPPFSFSRPLRFFHFVGFAVPILGLGLIAGGLAHWMLLPIIAGILAVPNGLAILLAVKRTVPADPPGSNPH